MGNSEKAQSLPTFSWHSNGGTVRESNSCCIDISQTDLSNGNTDSIPKSETYLTQTSRTQVDDRSPKTVIEDKIVIVYYFFDNSRDAFSWRYCGNFQGIDIDSRARNS
jgi:hypothetical protein